MYIIYKHTCVISGKSYIGYTKRGILKRWQDKIRHSKNLKNKWKIDRALRKYPNENQWKHKVIIDKIPILEEAKILEVLCIFYYDTFVNGYNSTLGGEGYYIIKGKKLSKEHRKKISESEKGKIISEETRKKISKSSKGKIISEETRIKISKSSKGKIMSKISKEKNRQWHLGKRASKKTRKKMSESHRGHVVSKITKRRLSKSHKNKKHTEAHIKHQIESRSLNWQIIYPSGKMKIIKNLNQFCKNNNLNSGAMCQVAKGKLKQHKGFKCEKLCI
jgi:hypothetical protein